MNRLWRAAGLLVLFLPLCAAAQDRVLFLQDVTIPPGQTAGEIICFWCNIRAQGAVTDDVISVLGSVELHGSASGDVVAIGGSIRLGPNARLDGDAVALGGPVERHPQAQVKGGTEAHPYAYVPGQREPRWPGAVAFLGISLTAALLLSAAMRRRRLANSAALLHRRWLACLAIGALAILLTVLLLAFAEYAGDWEDAVVLAVLLLLLILALPGYAGVSALAGQKLARLEGATGVAAGSLATALLMIVPVVGTLVWLLVGILSIGVAVFSRFGGRAPVPVEAGASPAG